MIDVLTTLKNEMEKLNIPYTFDTWDNDVELPQFIGEISETTNINEDGKSEYTFNVPEDTVEKEVHWYLMNASNYYSKPQQEEYFTDSGYYKYHEAIHLLKFVNERQILERAYSEYQELRRKNQWTN